MSRATLVPEEMGDRREDTRVSTTRLPFLELNLDEKGDELLCLDGCEFDRAFNLPIHEQLLLEKVRK